MQKSVIKIIALTLAVLAAALFLNGCGAASAPGAVTLSAGGEELSKLEVLYGDELPQLTAAVSPDGYSGEITWESDDAGVVKVVSSDGNTCSLTALKPGSAKITATCDGVSASVKIIVSKNQDNLTVRDTAVSINGVKYSVEKVNMYFADQYYNFLTEYGSYAAYMGLDTSTGLSGLDRQDCYYSNDGTWRGYFLDSAVSAMEQMQALCAYAGENGIALNDDDLAEIDSDLASLEEAALSAGYDSMESYLTVLYGEGVTEELYRGHLEESALASKAYEAYIAALSYTDEEISAHYAEMGYEGTDNDYPMTAMRHILVLAEADEDGNYTDEAIAAAHEKAEEIYAGWQSGEATEESFAALAEEYSEDSGSNTDGGLYENIYNGEMVDGINTWLFAAGRKAGDTAVIDNNGSYVGTHIVYFVGSGENYSTYLSVSDLQSTDASEWLTALTADDTVEIGGAYSQAGCF